MFNRLTIAVLLSASMSMLVACGEDSSSPSPQAPAAPAPIPPAAMSDEDAAKATIVGMLKLAEAGEWTKYVNEYYGELDKNNSPDGVARLAKRYEEKYGPKLIAVLKQASTLTPTIDGDKAVFAVDGQPIYILHRGDGGKWTFHL